MRKWALVALTNQQLAMHNYERGAAVAREAFSAAASASHELLLALTIGYLAAVERPNDAKKAARMLGNSRARLTALQWNVSGTDRRLHDHLHEELVFALGEADLQALIDEGARWTEDEALGEAARV